LDDEVILEATQFPNDVTSYGWFNGSTVMKNDLIDAKTNKVVMLLVGG
ncbi:unnamed protein product, partial [Rotaria sp. Silwood1]